MRALVRVDFKMEEFSTHMLELGWKKSVQIQHVLLAARATSCICGAVFEFPLLNGSSSPRSLNRRERRK